MSGWLSRWLPPLLRWGADDQRGAVLPLTAVGLVAALAATSLTIDIGRIANRRRDLQAVADVVALDASRALAGRSLGSIVAAESTFLAQVEASAKDNRFLEKDVVRTLGTADAGDRFVTGGAVPNAWSLESAGSAQRLLVVLGTAGTAGFQPVQFVPPVRAEGATDEEFAAVEQAAVDAANATVVDAVRVVAHDRIDHQFSPGSNWTRRSAVASVVAGAGAGIRSGLASIDGSLQDRMFGQVLGVDFGAADYQALAGGSVTLADLVTHFQAGSLDELLHLDLPATALFDAYAVLLQRDPAQLIAAQLMENASTTVGTPALKLAQIVSVAPGGDAAALATGIDALTILTGTAFVIGQTHGINLDLAGNVPGVASIPVQVTVIEPPQWVFGPTGTVVRTAQLRALARPQLAWSSANYAGDKCQLLEKGLVSGLTDCLVNTLLGIVGGLKVISVHNLARIDVNGALELDLGVARGTAGIGRVLCAADGVAPSVTLDGITASAATAVRQGTLAVRAVLLPGDPDHETPVSLGSASFVGETAVAPRQAAPITFDAVPDDGDPETPELPDLGQFVGTGGFGAGVVAPPLSIPWTPDPAPVLEVVTDANGTLGEVAAQAFQTVVGQTLQPLVGDLLTRLEAGLGVGLANVEVTGVAPTCSQLRLAA